MCWSFKVKIHLAGSINNSFIKVFLYSCPSSCCLVSNVTPVESISWGLTILQIIGYRSPFNQVFTHCPASLLNIFILKNSKNINIKRIIDKIMEEKSRYLNIKINWKHLSYALIISVILNGIAGIILLIDYVGKVSSVFESLFSEPEYLEGVIPKPLTMTIIAGSYQDSVTAFWIWILIFALSFVFLTLVSYFVIGHINKSRKS